MSCFHGASRRGVLSSRKASLCGLDVASGRPKYPDLLVGLLDTLSSCHPQSSSQTPFNRLHSSFRKTLQLAVRGRINRFLDGAIVEVLRFVVPARLRMLCIIHSCQTRADVRFGEFLCYSLSVMQHNIGLDRPLGPTVLVGQVFRPLLVIR